jgi:hypothetical protein
MRLQCQHGTPIVQRGMKKYYIGDHEHLALKLKAGP